MTVYMTLTQMMHWLNASKKKQKGTKFTVGDVQGYIKRKKLPKYMGGEEIVLNEEYKGVKLYKFVKNA